MAQCLRNCEECEYQNTCKECLTVEAIEKRLHGYRSDNKMTEGKGEPVNLGIRLKDILKRQRG